MSVRVCEHQVTAYRNVSLACFQLPHTVWGTCIIYIKSQNYKQVRYFLQEKGRTFTRKVWVRHDVRFLVTLVLGGTDPVLLPMCLPSLSIRVRVFSARTKVFHVNICLHLYRNRQTTFDSRLLPSEEARSLLWSSCSHVLVDLSPCHWSLKGKAIAM